MCMFMRSSYNAKILIEDVSEGKHQSLIRGVFATDNDDPAVRVHHARSLRTYSVEDEQLTELLSNLPVTASASCSTASVWLERTSLMLFVQARLFLTTLVIFLYISLIAISFRV
jgi:hypothetical protein